MRLTGIFRLTGAEDIYSDGLGVKNPMRLSDLCNYPIRNKPISSEKKTGAY